MGTSKSYGGPGGKPPLLPRWAQGDGAPIPETGNESLDPNPLPNPLPEKNPLPQPIPAPESIPPPPRLPEVNLWSQAKRSMGRFASSGGAGNIRKAAGDYVRARGGATRAAKAVSAGRAATAGVVNFLSDVATRGIGEALHNIGLGEVLGQPVEKVLAAIVNALAPAGANFDDAAARRTVSEALTQVFERFGVEEGGISRLNAMDATGVAEAFRVSVAEFIFQRLMCESGKSVETKAISDREAHRRELELKAYIVETVKLDMRGRDVLTTDWKSRQNQQVIENIYREAYRLMEVAG